jgi:hypothetical protein
MAVKPLANLALIFLVILAGIAVAIGARSRLLNYSTSQEKRFVSTYLAMSLARERFIGNPDSLKIALKDVFEIYGTDSVWMANYGKRLSIDLKLGNRIWADITTKLDSLRKNPNPDGLILNRQRQP